MSADDHATPPDASVLIPFRHGSADDPVAIVIGLGHMPYYLYRDGRTERATPIADDDGPTP
ncbi:hypothetical protein [Phenylobacterium aquaticum]|uniref:hypothetical protein n=1 Tax=Phenylobacterium aquaticum TaxID=1763816 RepID=UPI001F5D3AAA|nr:hypothetical protein [Phenylobacterium aquaticum]MCI3132827.1 hypothetical protein [Phenylobacterium aquaticum]